MRINSCSWVLRRLPLLDGGELAMDERRRVERHLIGCPDCRDRRSASVDSLSALRAFAEASPARPDAPSLWPALARQIRESKHVPARPAWSWSWLFSQASPAMGLGLALGGVLAAGFALGRTAPAPTSARAPSSTARAASDLAPGVLARADRAADKPRGALPETPPNLLTRSADSFRVPNMRFDYDLDHGFPMGSGPRDPQRSY